ncbi:MULTISPECIES: SDR family oxidoreductase [unclassified Brenneria]|uniref:SDR family oxidoreductase n=1 Tax=unclassified Brenneria TaxID=2634434 RepID=UPI0029C4995B|nr:MULTISPECIES: SDR family oxidoreductase [unclassified Brenneria]MDX5627172.1 SDR family oxidoreductase [Brenneria sp. L3-3Z]MDX5694673.1 SDR family oxidoreductase [Brenneria sp. L4-2C]
MSNSQPIALVSGATRGIGKAIAQGLAQQGVKVLLGARNLQAGREVAERIATQHVSVEAVELDTTDQTTIDNLAALIRQKYGRLDILVNNAGISMDFSPEPPIREKLSRTFETNVVGTAALTDAMIPLLEKSERARIVNVSSILASFTKRTQPDWIYADVYMPSYQASKAALNSLTLSYARQLADRNIKVNAICPGLTATDATNHYGDRTPEMAAQVAIRFALLDDSGPTGSFANDEGALEW